MAEYLLQIEMNLGGEPAMKIFAQPLKQWGEYYKQFN